MMTRIFEVNKRQEKSKITFCKLNLLSASAANSLSVGTKTVTNSFTAN